jgi:colanic acid biosynthesis glycosyl transferase WcaI
MTDIESQRKTIFFNKFFYPDHSATAQILSDLAFHLAGNGRRVLVVTTDGQYDDPSTRLPPQEIVSGVDIRRVYRPRFGRSNLLGRVVDYLFIYVCFVRAVFRFAAEGDVIVAKTDPPLLSIMLLPVARWKKAKFVNWLQDVYPEVAVQLGMKSIKLLSTFLKPLRDQSLRFADLNVVIGEKMQFFLADLNVPSGRISLIPNWFDDSIFTHTSPETRSARKDWGLEDRFVVAYSGNLGLAHEYLTVLRAAERLRGEKNLAFLFIGGGALTSKIRNDVRERGLEHLFQFRPYQPIEALCASLSLPDVFWASLLPSMEGLIVPSKFYGNCAAGKPTIFIGDPEGEISRIIKRCDCGAIIEVGDGERLAQTILALRKDTEKLNEMGRNARSTLEHEFSRTRAFTSWDNLLDALLRTRSPRPS